MYIGLPFSDTPFGLFDLGELHEVPVIVVFVMARKLLCQLLSDTHDHVPAFRESGIESSSLLITDKLSSGVLFFRQLNSLSAVPKRCPDARFANLLGLRTQAKNVAEERGCHSWWEKCHRRAGKVGRW